MTQYLIEVPKSVIKSLRRVPNLYTRKIDEAISQLAENPYPEGCKRVIGGQNEYRIRVGIYRIIYKVSDTRILVLKVGHRRDVYR